MCAAYPVCSAVSSDLNTLLTGWKGANTEAGAAGKTWPRRAPSFRPVSWDSLTGRLTILWFQKCRRCGRWSGHLRAAAPLIQLLAAHWRPVLTAVINSTPHNPGFWTRQESELRTCILDQAHTPPQQASSPPDPGWPPAQEILPMGVAQALQCPDPARCLMNPLPVLWLSERRGSGLPLHTSLYHSRIVCRGDNIDVIQFTNLTCLPKFHQQAIHLENFFTSKSLRLPGKGRERDLRKKD